MPHAHSDHYEIHTEGGVSGQVVAGRHNTVSRTQGAATAPGPVTEQELAALRAEFARVRALLPQDAPERAGELLDELEESATAPEPDLSTMEYVRRWFTRHLPSLAGAVTGLVIHPVVGHLVEVAGGTLTEEFRRRFGNEDNTS
ncbi:hypothetical protein ACFU9Y_10695 [Streptomyces sp. NPDC057621]|uniref:hypothetical protein n=1 Tax=Streptomyces sp. NPDC057621 TaxID=3346186 RepID=UPI0036B03960